MNKESSACDHCGLPVPDGRSRFCCAGCEVAYETIHGAGLENYYSVRQRLATKRRAASGAGKRYAAYDSDAFQRRYASPAADGLRAIDLRLEGVHCAACVWLVERLPKIAPGVVDARLMLGAARARVVWDPQATSLSAVAQSLDRLGYAPHPARDRAARDARSRSERRRLVDMAIAGALAGNNMLVAIGLYAGAAEGIEPRFENLFRWLSLAIGWLSIAWPGRVFFRGAAAALRARTANLDLPIALALLVGAVAGTANVVMGRGEVYFDSLSVLVFLLLVGRFIQLRQQRWAEDSVGLMLSMTPDECRVVRGDRVEDESVDALDIGDVVEVRAGDLFPADGVVTTGRSAVDRSILTGESRPVPVGPGAEVCAGAQNLASTLRLEVSAVGDDTRLGRLVRLVEDGVAAKPPIVQFADRVAGWFVSVVAVLAAVNLAWWASRGPLSGAIDSTVALLIVACPCALGLATPLTMAIAIGRGAKRGMLIKSAAVLERLADVSPDKPGRLLIDKTGTLTTGRLRVEGWAGDRQVQPWVAAVEAQSSHPVAAALVRVFGPAEQRDGYEVSDRVERHGFGVTAATPLGRMMVGSPRFAEEAGVEVGGEIAGAIRLGRRRGLTVALVAIEGRAVGVAWLGDDLHPDAREHLATLGEAGWRAEILSGDTPDAVRHTAAAVGLNEEAGVGGAAPEEKLQRVRAAEQTPQAGPVMMVGDGVNDAAALAAADIGVAVQGGAEASLAAADVYLTEPGVGKLVELVRLGQATMRVARRNLAISLAYNLVAVTLAAAGWIGPLAAAILMPISSLTVLASAVRFSGDGAAQAEAARVPKNQSD
ncbi:heavy metal translocating P-type ATPase [Botrimarina sp.]|uniref:heavy metal translocating P-type ATPase n=1 Tax=Botrimarina sp. TaxID=2795802 RepID=UPI0032ED4B38